MVLTSALGALARAADAVPPLTPDGDEARRWAEDELSDPSYDIAEPTPFDRIARAIGDFIASLFNPDLSGGWGSTFALVAGIVVVLIIAAAFLIWGVPRVSRRAAARSSAARVFPTLEDRLEEAATAFDDVRYLRRPGTAELYRLVAAVDDAVASAQPAAREAVPA
ncbi:hypothetical protein ACI3KY_15755 [Microbacterium sp. ZW T2_14]|uniref:hypothetical protein n=1 Tax=Microbacterium sp. ZW T2_14 TaxID=3378079 RepID=UPI0038535695